MLPVDFVFDYETLGAAPKGVVIELSYVPFIDDPNNPPTFAELVAKGRKYKFDIRNQPGRQRDAGTIEWWKKQSVEAKSILRPSPEDTSVKEGHEKFLADLKADGISRWDSMDYCRGPEFDRGILIDVIRQITGEIDTYNSMPTMFWNSRDVRTAIENRLLSRGLTNTPLRRGILEGFIKHNSIHDCAKDALMLIYATRYANGMESPPEGDEIDPLSLSK